MKKIFLTILLFFVFIFLTAGNPVTAADTNPLIEYRDQLKSSEPSLNQWIGGKNPETAEGKRANGVIDSIILKGISLTAGFPDENGNFTGGLIGISGAAMASLFDTPPASGVTYFADLLHNVGIAKPAYAQGVGFTGLSPVLTIWKAFRNFAYLLITILFIVLGLMIMFRVKLSPQAVISVQDAIPKIAVTLVLITFSYAIAGLLIDLSNLVLILFIKVFESANLLNAPQTSSEWLNAGIGRIMTHTISTLVSGVGGLLISNWTTVGTALGIGGLAALLGFVVPGGPAVLSALVPVLLVLFLGVVAAIFGLVIKIVIMLIKAYVSIIIGVIFGPLQIIFDALPGQKISAFNTWLKSLLANVLVFPFVALLFLITSVFDKLFGIGSNSANLWTPPTLSGNNQMVLAFIKIGVLLIIPNVDKIIMQALDVKTSLGSALGRDPLLEKMDRFYTREMKASTSAKMGGAITSIGGTGATGAGATPQGGFWGTLGSFIGGGGRT